MIFAFPLPPQNPNSHELPGGFAPLGPHQALPWTRWGPWRSPDPSPIQGAPPNVNSWIRAWFLSQSDINCFHESII